jgi:uncharacterized membrane protein
VLPAVAYPLLAHAATVTASSRLTLASVVALALAVLLPGLLALRPAAWLGAVLATAVIALLARQDAAALLLFLPPVLINVFMAWLFGRTLGSGRPSLIERLVRLLHPPEEDLDPAIAAYAARLTAAWTVLFTTLASVNLLLALFATPGGLLEAAGLAPTWAVPIETWSLFANLLNYLVVGLFFVVEWIYRRRRFPQQPYRNLLDFLRRAAAVAPALLADLHAGRGDAQP